MRNEILGFIVVLISFFVLVFILVFLDNRRSSNTPPITPEESQIIEQQKQREKERETVYTSWNNFVSSWWEGKYGFEETAEISREDLNDLLPLFLTMCPLDTEDQRSLRNTIVKDWYVFISMVQDKDVKEYTKDDVQRLFPALSSAIANNPEIFEFGNVSQNMQDKENAELIYNKEDNPENKDAK